MGELNNLRKYFIITLNIIVLMSLILGTNKLNSFYLYFAIFYGFSILVFMYLKFKKLIHTPSFEAIILSSNMIILGSLFIFSISRFKNLSYYLVHIAILITITNGFINFKIRSDENNTTLKKYILENQIKNIIIFTIYAILYVISNTIYINSKYTIVLIMTAPIFISIFLAIKKPQNIDFSMFFIYLLCVRFVLEFNILKMVNTNNIDYIYDLKTTVWNMEVINLVIFFICLLIWDKEQKKRKEIEEELALQEAKRMIEEEKRLKENIG